jgi:flagellar protein FliS
MFGLNQRGVNGYAKVSVETGVLAASPIKLIIMLYDGAIAACHNAVGHMQRGEIINKSSMLTKAIMIIESGLRLSLDKRAGGEIALSLDALYDYMGRQLQLANIRNQPELVREVIKLLTELKGAWEEIDQMQVKSRELSMPSQLQSILNANQTEVGDNKNVASFARA